MSLKYKKVLLSYADLLGFREHLRSKKAGEIKEALDAFRAGTKPEKSFADLYEVAYFNFSDLMVRATNLLSDANKKYAIGLLFHELLDLAYGQAAMASLGFLVRGAVTVGNLYSKSNMIFGDALVRAYKMESKLAVYPRIVVDPVVLRVFEETGLLKKDTHAHDDERPYIRRLLSKGSDGIYFVDYLRAMSREYADHFDTFMSQHAALIRSEASQMKELDGHSVKLTWLANYHNEVVAEWGDHDELTVSPEELPMMFDLPKDEGAA